MTTEKGYRSRIIEEKTDIKYIVRTLPLKRGICWQCSKERQINDWKVCRDCWRGWMNATKIRLEKERQKDCYYHEPEANE